jgi:hypothetical protein
MNPGARPARNAYPPDPGRAQRAENTRRAREAFLRRDPAPDAYPVMLEASLQAGCNADCLFCGTGEKWRAHPVRSAGDWLARRVLGELAPHVERFSWTCDNEPLQSRAFMDWLAGAPSLPVIHIQTNGVLLPERLEALASARAHLGMGVSLNAATARTHSMLMGCPANRFERIVAAMREFVRRGEGSASPGLRALSVVSVQPSPRV